MSGTNDRTAGLSGHLPAFITIFIWGTTYISTKILLQDFSPIQILLARFVIGFVILCWKAAGFVQALPVWHFLFLPACGAAL